MSVKLINRNPDLKRLRDEGYAISIASGHLAIADIPYVNAAKEVKRGTLFSKLTLAGDITTKPETHVVYFSGDHPCDKDGAIIAPLKHGSQVQELGGGIRIDHSFSNKPAQGFPDYYALVTSYVRIITAPAEFLKPGITAKTCPVYETGDEPSVFQYLDTHSSRSEITAITDKLRGQKIAIIGLGGTGAYILDLVAKTPVGEIHLYDGDGFSQHNAFRAPGAATIEQLRLAPKKVDYLKGIYDAMHRHITAHPVRVDASNVAELAGMTFVFIAIDDGAPKQTIMEALEAAGIAFVDVGMGLQGTNGHVTGTVRSTLSTPAKRDHVRRRVSFAPSGADDYHSNIQVADLNALNATLAVIAWKKTLGFYDDRERGHHCTYTLEANLFLSEEHANSA